MTRTGYLPQVAAEQMTVLDLGFPYANHCSLRCVITLRLTMPRGFSKLQLFVILMVRNVVMKKQKASRVTGTWALYLGFLSILSLSSINGVPMIEYLGDKIELHNHTILSLAVLVLTVSGVLLWWILYYAKEERIYYPLLFLSN
jgi:hypothetical protein